MLKSQKETGISYYNLLYYITIISYLVPHILSENVVCDSPFALDFCRNALTSDSLS